MSDTALNSTAAPAAAGHVEPWAMHSIASHARLWIVTVAGLAFDLWSKHWAFDRFEYHPFKHHEPMVLVKNFCNIQVSLNPGALFGLGAGMAPIFVGASVLALLFVLYLFANSPTTRWSMHIGLGLVLGGALGNLYDRTTQAAYVAYYPDGSRVIGTLVGEVSDHGMKLASFPRGLEPRFIPGRPDPARSGPQPVVRDFIKIEAKLGRFYLWPWIFNIADALLVVGVIVIMINFWRDHRAQKASDLARAAANAPPA